MKRLLICFFIVGSLLELQGQDVITNQSSDKNHLRFGLGYFGDYLYFNDEGFPPPGLCLWIEGGRKLKTGFYVNAKVSFAIVSSEFKNSKNIDGQNRHTVYTCWVANFSRPFSLGKGHYIDPSLGMLLRSWWSFYPRLENIQGEQVLLTGSGTTYDFGLDYTLSYYYKFNNGFYLGSHLGGYYLFALGHEGITFSPLIGVKF